MSSKFLDKTGLDTLWAKIKATFQTLGNLVTAWSSTPSDTKYPSEKLVKMALDGKVPTSRTVNGRELSSDISLTASDVGASPSSHQHSTSDITSGTLPVGRGGTGKASVTAGNYLVGNGTSALAEKTPTAAANDMLSALPDDWTATPTDGVKLIRRDTGGGASFGQVTFLTVWNYIKTKIYNGGLGSGNRPVYWTGSNLALSKPSPNANLMGSVGKTTAANARADTAALANTTINCNNGSYYYLNAMKFIENVPYTFLIPSVNANKSGLVTSTKLKVYQIGASDFDLGTGATLYLDKAGGSSTLHEIVFAYRVGTTLYIFHQY